MEADSLDLWKQGPVLLSKTLWREEIGSQGILMRDEGEVHLGKDSLYFLNISHPRHANQSPITLYSVVLPSHITANKKLISFYKNYILI